MPRPANYVGDNAAWLPKFDTVPAADQWKLLIKTQTMSVCLGRERRAILG